MTTPGFPRSLEYKHSNMDMTARAYEVQIPFAVRLRSGEIDMESCPGIHFVGFPRSKYPSTPW
jgi:hypothetical protein